MSTDIETKMKNHKAHQLCVLCYEPTERGEDDSIYLDDETGPLCPDCFCRITLED